MIGAALKDRQIRSVRIDGQFVLAGFIKDDAVLVAAHGGHVQIHENLRRASRVQRSVQAIAEIDHVADAAAADIVEDRSQRPAVAVNV